MDANIIISRLIVIGIAWVIIGIGAFMLHFGRYLSAPEDKKQDRAKAICLYSIVLLFVGIAYLIGSLLVLTG